MCPGLINAVMTGEDISPFIMQTAHSDIAQYRGHMGKNSMAGISWQADNDLTDDAIRMEVRRSPRPMLIVLLWFNTSVDDFVAREHSLQDWTDAGTFHRRDYNMLPQIHRPMEISTIPCSAAVYFCPDIDLPWLDGTSFPDHYSTLPSMTQLLDQYHTGTLPIYAEDPMPCTPCSSGGIGLVLL